MASSLSDIAPTLWLLVAATAGQGLGAAIKMFLAMAFVGETVPKGQTGSAIGLLGMMSATGTALIPTHVVALSIALVAYHLTWRNWAVTPEAG